MLSHCRLYFVSFPITASSAKFAVQCPLWLGHFTAIPLFRSLDATLQSFSMQHLANKVGSVIVKHNPDDMKEIRETIVEENEMCGFENPNLVACKC
jgi:hypothetical protein